MSENQSVICQTYRDRSGEYFAVLAVVDGERVDVVKEVDWGTFTVLDRELLSYDNNNNNSNKLGR